MKYHLYSFGILLFVLPLNAKGQDKALDELIHYQFRDCPFLSFEDRTVENPSVFCLENYAFKYSFDLNSTVLTFHIIAPENLIIPKSRSKAKRLSNFPPVLFGDTLISRTNYDYKSSGYDRGHLVPAGDFIWNQHLKNLTFYHVNIVHQKDFLNRGVWLGLESKIRQRVIDSKSKAYVYTGAFFAENQRDSVGENLVDVAEAMYKMVYLPKEEVAYCWLFMNKIQSTDALENHQITVDQLESLIGHDFLSGLSLVKENKIESSLVMFDGSKR
ncbi:MAG: DNA/RNA non-specific endonuclease [Roseivirga sp.]|nr:DNA/RNA non-specific endonuclease [Roseivirga sp.]